LTSLKILCSRAEAERPRKVEERKKEQTSGGRRAETRKSGNHGRTGLPHHLKKKHYGGKGERNVSTCGPWEPFAKQVLVRKKKHTTKSHQIALDEGTS